MSITEQLFFIVIDSFVFEISEENVNGPGIGRNLTYMFLTGVTFFSILFIMEFRVPSKIAQCIANCWKMMRKNEKEGVFTASNMMDESDVEEEKRKVDALTSTDLHFNDLVLRRLSKFRGKQFTVNQISVAIKRYFVYIFCII